MQRTLCSSLPSTLLPVSTCSHTHICLHTHSHTFTHKFTHSHSCRTHCKNSEKELKKDKICGITPGNVHTFVILYTFKFYIITYICCNVHPIHVCIHVHVHTYMHVIIHAVSRRVQVETRFCLTPEFNCPCSSFCNRVKFFRVRSQPPISWGVSGKLPPFCG